MKERPILFSAPMVRALVAGTKTQTRRAMKPQPMPDGNLLRWGAAAWGEKVRSVPVLPGHSLAARCPYGKPGDVLWIREAWRAADIYDGTPPAEIPGGAAVWYEADGKHVPQRTGDLRLVAGKLRPGIHQPRWMCRLRLLLTEVRVERLKSISDDDALAEGIDRAAPLKGIVLPTPVDAYEALWDSINGPGAFAKDAWVWVLHFQRFER